MTFYCCYSLSPVIFISARQKYLIIFELLRIFIKNVIIYTARTKKNVHTICIHFIFTPLPSNCLNIIFQNSFKDLYNCLTGNPITL